MSKKNIGGWFKSTRNKLGQGKDTFGVGLSKLGLFNLFVNKYKGGGEVKQAIN